MIRFTLELGPFVLIDAALFERIGGEAEIREFADSSSVAFGFSVEEPEVDEDWFEEVPEEMRRG